MSCFSVIVAARVDVSFEAKRTRKVPSGPLPLSRVHEPVLADPPLEVVACGGGGSAVDECTGEKKKKGKKKKKKRKRKTLVLTRPLADTQEEIETYFEIDGKLKLISKDLLASNLT